MPRKAKPQRAATVQNRYDAAGSGRRMRGWNPATNGPNRAMEGLQKIRDRSRDSVRNDWTGESGVQKWATALVGIGIAPRVTKITNSARKTELVDLWDDWVRVADADGVQNFYGMQTLLVRTWLESGEVFIRQRSRRESDGLPVPLQIQMIEPDYVPLLDADAWPGLPFGHKIRSGIELNYRNQRIAYWVHRQHPLDFMGALDPSMLLRIPVNQMLHVYEIKRPGQLRGVPSFASVLAKLRNTNDYEDAVLERQKLANLFAMFITRGVTPDGDVDPLSGLPIDYSANGENPLAGLQPGIVQELGFGEDVRFSNPPEAGTTYSDYLRTQHLGTSAASGLPYEVFSGDIREVSDRTLRVVINEHRRFAEQRQWQIIIPQFCQPVRDWWTQAAVLAGLVGVTESEAVRRVQWAPQGWAYMHPVQDAQGKKIEVEAGFRSRASVVAERGDDPEVVDAERADDLAREESLGLYVDPMDIEQQKLDMQNAKTQEQINKADAQEKAQAAEARARLALLQAQQRTEEVQSEVALADAKLRSAQANSEKVKAEAQSAELEMTRLKLEQDNARQSEKHSADMEAALQARESAAAAAAITLQTLALQAQEAQDAAIAQAEIRRQNLEAARNAAAIAATELEAAQHELASYKGEA